MPWPRRWRRIWRIRAGPARVHDSMRVQMTAQDARRRGLLSSASLRQSGQALVLPPARDLGGTPLAPSILDQRVVIPSSVIFRELDGESVLLSFDSERYYGLDVVGTRIWQTLAEAETVRAAFDRLLQEFDVEPDLLQRDIEALMRELSAQGLVVLEAAPPAG